MLSFPLYEVPSIVKYIETESRIKITGAGDQGIRSCSLMDTEFLFGMMKNFWKYREVMIAQHCE